MASMSYSTLSQKLIVAPVTASTLVLSLLMLLICSPDSYSPSKKDMRVLLSCSTEEIFQNITGMGGLTGENMTCSFLLQYYNSGSRRHVDLRGGGYVVRGSPSGIIGDIVVFVFGIWCL